MAEAQGPAESNTGNSSGKGGIITLLVTFLLIALVGLGFVGWQMLSNQEASNKPKLPHFMKMDPFIVTLKSGSRSHYLQIKLSLMSRNPEALSTLETYRPMVRNEIIRYLSTIEYESVNKPNAPDTIRASAMSRVNNLLIREQVGHMSIEDIIVTDMVVQ